MADRTVYIYPNGTSDPVGAANYTTMALMEAGEDGDITGVADYLDVIITPSDGDWSTPDSSPVVFAGWICDRGSSEYIKIRTTGTARNSYSNGLWSTTAYRLEHAGSDEPIDINNGDTNQFDIDFDGVQITQTTNADQLIRLASAKAGSTVRFLDSYLWNQTAGDNVRGYGTAYCIIWCFNCIIRGAVVGVRNEGDVAVYLYNCTVTGQSTLGVQGEAAGNYMRTVNCAVFDTPNDFHGSFAVGHPQYSACDDAESGANNCVDISPANGDEDSKHDLAFTDHDNGDYRVKDTNSVLYHAGITNEDDANVPTTDIAGNPRVTGTGLNCDIGAFELVAAPSGRIMSSLVGGGGLAGMGGIAGQGGGLAG